jgi:uncharacterized protein (DUF1778 family)
MATPTQTEIPVTLRLSRDAETKLAERAAASGQDLSQYISTLVESVVESARTLEEISGPVYQRFLDSGTTDGQLSDELERAKHEMRAERRGRQAS